MLLAIMPLGPQDYCPALNYGDDTFTLHRYNNFHPKGRTVGSVLTTKALSLEKRMAKLSSSMNKRVEDLANLVNSKLDKYDDTRVKIIDDNQKRVESKVDQIISSVKQQKVDDMHLHDCVQQAIHVKLQEDKEEMEEINKRKTNVIIRGLK